MADEPDPFAMALVRMALSLARSPGDLAEFGRVNAETFQGFDPPTLQAARAAYARRRDELRGDRK